MYINFQLNQVNRAVLIEHTNLFAINANCINLQLGIRILKNPVLGHALPPNGHSGRL